MILILIDLPVFSIMNLECGRHFWQVWFYNYLFHFTLFLSLLILQVAISSYVFAPYIFNPHSYLFSLLVCRFVYISYLITNLVPVIKLLSLYPTPVLSVSFLKDHFWPSSQQSLSLWMYTDLNKFLWLFWNSFSFSRPKSFDPPKNENYLSNFCTDNAIFRSCLISSKYKLPTFK